MNIKRFHAPTSREALAKARMAFGEGTLILSNRPTAGGVEVVATAEDALSSITPTEDTLAAPATPATPTSAASRPLPKAQPATPSAAAQPQAAKAPAGKTPVEADTEQLAMSTLSFQDYVRERMLRRRHEALQGDAAAAALADTLPQEPRKPASAAAFVPAAAALPPTRPAAQPTPAHLAPASLPPLRTREPAAAAQPATPAAPAVRHAASSGGSSTTTMGHAGSANATANSGSQAIARELQEMKALIEDRFHTLAWLGQARQDPIQSNLMLKLIRAGYSPMLARAVLERMPEGIAPAQAVRWLMDTLERNLKTDAGEPSLCEEGGVFALVGATGVGKTTTAAKLAARCVRQHGPNSVGLVTLDTYRVAAHEQLRAYGRMLGIVAHLAHDRAALQDLLGLLANKKMVLIDTTGVAPRDPRKREMLEVLDLPHVQRLLVLNAGGHGDTLDEMLASFGQAEPQQTILSKVDEAVKLGPALDSIIRHQLLVRGITNGQRVPEDWEAADPGKLVRQSMRAPAKSAFDPKIGDLNLFFMQAPSMADVPEEAVDA